MTDRHADKFPFKFTSAMTFFGTLWLVAAFGACPALPADETGSGKPGIQEWKLDAQAASNPQIKLIAPPAGSPDKVEFTTDGLHVKQVTESGNSAKTSGFEIDVKSDGPFVFTLHFDVQRLEPPRAARAQGIWVRFVFDGDQTPAFGLVASSKIKRGLGFVKSHNDSPKLPFQVEPIEFQRGAWIIERKGPDLLLSIGDGAYSFREVKRIPAPTGALRKIEVWCSRFSAGNSPLEATFKSVTFAGSDYLMLPPPGPPLFTLSRILWTLVSLGVVGGSIVGGLKAYEKYR